MHNIILRRRLRSMAGNRRSTGRENDGLGARYCVGYNDRAGEPIRRFSGGMKRRLNFGCGVVHRPKVLLLDEPTVGVDPQSRIRLLDIVREQVRQGTTVLYATHYMVACSPWRRCRTGRPP